MYDFAIIGGGIVGLATAKGLGERHPRANILVLEKENAWGQHQTGHNSGVIHSGIYYKPGSLKARLATDGGAAMVEFCAQQGISYDTCGKVIVATEAAEVPLLDALYERGKSNGLTVNKIGPGELREIEPHVQGIAGIHVPITGIVNYKTVCEALARYAEDKGAVMLLCTEVNNVHEAEDGVTIETGTGTYRAKIMVNCAGLQSDRVARMGHQNVNLRIVPFRGEYYELIPERRYLVKNLIYPVPNPQFPFLGVHFTRMIDGRVEAGPNAVLGFRREGYRKTDFNFHDFFEVMGYRGFWRLAAKYWRNGMGEIVRSMSKMAFVRSLQRLVPEIQSADLVPALAGVRAQALRPDGTLVDDFYFISGKRSLHVCNAPSPAATASLEIGRLIVARLTEQFGDCFMN